MGEFTYTIIGFVLTFIMGAASLIWQIVQHNKEEPGRDAEAASAISESAVLLVKPLREEVEILKKQCAKTESELREIRNMLTIAFEYIDYVMRGVMRLINQLNSHNLVPVWEPETFEEFKERRLLTNDEAN